MRASPGGGHVGRGARPHSGQSGGPVAECSPTRHHTVRDASGVITQSSMQESARSGCRALGDHTLDPVCDGSTTVSPRGRGEKEEPSLSKPTQIRIQSAGFRETGPERKFCRPFATIFSLFSGESV